jgi:hypothetical protein
LAGFEIHGILLERPEWLASLYNPLGAKRVSPKLAERFAYHLGGGERNIE